MRNNSVLELLEFVTPNFAPKVHDTFSASSCGGVAGSE